MTKPIVKKLRAFCKEDEHAARIFNVWASLKKDRYESPLRVISDTSHVPYSNAIAVTKILSEMEVGKFWNGRGSKETRFEFWCSRQELARAALGKTDELEIWYGDDDEEDEDLDDEENAWRKSVIKSYRQTIAVTFDIDVKKVKLKCEF